MPRSREKQQVETLFELEQEPEAPREEAVSVTPGLFARIALNRPVRRQFTYGVPDAFAETIAPGCRVVVPFGSRRQIGMVVELERTTDLPSRKLKHIAAVLDSEPVVDEGLLGLTRWMAERYACSWGEALAAVLPAPLKRGTGSRKVARISLVRPLSATELEELAERFPKQHRIVRTLAEIGEPVDMVDLLRRLQLSDSPAKTLRKKGLVRVDYVDIPRDVLSAGFTHRTRPEQLSRDQERALAAIRAPLAAREHRTFCLQGVTGSGKTEVYLRVIEEALAQGRAAIVLVPEIALTPQTVAWFRSRFGDVCVMHSRMTDAERMASWNRLARGEVHVAVGARSAIFAPVKNLGVVVVDEEHEPSFKQENSPRYHARDVAVERARRSGAVCILGSATPSLETYYRAAKKEYEHVLLPKRVGGGATPTVHVVDTNLEKERGRSPLFSRLLSQLLTETLKAGEQTILFLNRRGFVSILWCPGCEKKVGCHQCSSSLTYHKKIDRLVCHTCCEERARPTACPTCTRPGLRLLGVGSERVEVELAKLWPEARVKRMDSDTMRRREDYENTLAAFERHEIDVLVGTQMIAKGLDFPRVTLVGIVSADHSLQMSDFRSSERTFQLIAQVAGRAGRSSLPGRIVVQTRAPREPAIVLAAAGDFDAFARYELLQRKEAGYPPFQRLLRVIFEDVEEERVKQESEQLADALRAQTFSRALRVLGPGVAPLALVRNRHRHHFLVKLPPDDPAFPDVVAWLADQAAGKARPQVKIDVDPMSVM